MRKGSTNITVFHFLFFFGFGIEWFENGGLSRWMDRHKLNPPFFADFLEQILPYKFGDVELFQ